MSMNIYIYYLLKSPVKVSITLSTTPPTGANVCHKPFVDENISHSAQHFITLYDTHFPFLFYIIAWARRHDGKKCK